MNKYSKPCLESCTPYGHSQGCPNAKLKDLCRYDLMKEVDQLLAENTKLKAELVKERECVDYYGDGEIGNDLEVRPDKKELWSIPDKWSQRSMSDHYCGKRARQRQEERDQSILKEQL